MHKAQREVYETKTYFACLHKGWAKKLIILTIYNSRI